MGNKTKLEIKGQQLLWKDRKRPIFGLPLSFTRYELYEDRLIKSKGFLNVVEEEIMLFRVIDFKITLSLFQKMFGVGTVILTTSDATNKEVLLSSIQIPREVKQYISDKVMEQRKMHRIRGYDRIGGGIDDLEDDMDNDI